jgi:serine/threonine-protein kinase
MSANWERIEALFAEASALSPDDRPALLDRECAGSAELRGELESLLAAYGPAQTFLHDGHQRFHATLEGAFQEYTLAGRLIGPYRVGRHIGQGGAGIVLEVVDTRTGERAAMKILASHLAHGVHLVRFRREAHILTLLDHPGIARLRDHGSTGESQPYLVMDFVEGVRIDEYCDGNHLRLEARLRLFVQVCEAVQAAHERLVAHLDLKPSNILVTSDGEAKVLDFGAAKLFEVDQGHTTTRPLTTGYASPEQLRGEPVSTACDVYSLGVMLYELLAGASPFPQSGSLASIVERAGGDTDPRPLPESPTEAAAAGRHATLAQLRSDLRGDLQSIVAKALAGAPAARYKSPADLAADIGRYLEGRPVLAQPQTPLYRAGKFVRRNRVVVSVAVLMAVALLGVGVYATLQQRRALTEARRAATSYNFLVDLLTLPGSDSASRPDMTVSELLELAGKRAYPAQIGDPAAALGLYRALARALLWREAIPQANALFNKAYALAQASGDLPWQAVIKSYLAHVASGSGQRERAVALAQESLAMWRDHRSQFPPKQAIEVLYHSGVILQVLRPEGTNHRQYLEEALRIARANLPQDDDRMLSAVLEGLAQSNWVDKRFAEADRLIHEAVALDRASPMHGSLLAISLQTQGRISQALGRYADDERAQREALEVFRTIAGPESSIAANQQANWANSLIGVGQVEEAYRQAAQGLALARKANPQGGQNLWANIASATYTSLLKGQYRESEALAREAIRTVGPSPSLEDGRWQGARGFLGLALAGQGKSSEARPLLEQSLEFFLKQERPSRFLDELKAAVAKLP